MYVSNGRQLKFSFYESYFKYVFHLDTFPDESIRDFKASIFLYCNFEPLFVKIFLLNPIG